MSSFDNQSHSSREPIEARPASIKLRFGDLGSELSLPGLEQAILTGLVTTTEDLSKNLSFITKLESQAQPNLLCELAWRFSRSAKSNSAQELGISLCREIDPQGIFTHVDLEQKIAHEIGQEASLQKRVNFLLKSTAPGVPFSERSLALDQVEDILSKFIVADPERSVASLKGMIFGQGIPSRSKEEYLDKIDRIIFLARSEPLKSSLMLLKEQELPDLLAGSTHSKAAVPRILGDERVPRLTSSALIDRARGSRELESMIEGAYLLLGQPVKTISAKIMATSAIESQWSNSPKVVELCRELRANLVERWFTPGQLHYVSELKELIFPSDYPLLIHPSERLERVDDLIKRSASHAAIRLAMYLREEVLPKHHPEFKLRWPGNIETLLFTDDTGQWRGDLTTQSEFELISRYLENQDRDPTAVLAKQLRTRMLDHRQSDIAPNKERLERLLFGEGAKFVSAKEVLGTLLDLRQYTTNRRVSQLCGELIDDLEREQKSIWCRFRRSGPVAALYRWLNRD